MTRHSTNETLFPFAATLAVGVFLSSLPVVLSACASKREKRLEARAEKVRAAKKRMRERRRNRNDDEEANDEESEELLELPDGPRVIAGQIPTCLLETDGSVWCWEEPADENAKPEDAAFVQLDAGRNHVCGVTRRGTIACWGDNEFYQASSQSAADYRKAAAGNRHSCGLTSDGSIRCWGLAHAKAKGDDDRMAYNQPVQDGTRTGFPPRSASNFVEVEAGEQFTCGRKESGAVECWSADDAPELDVPDRSFREIDATSRLMCGVRDDGRIECWGRYETVLEPSDSDSFGEVATGANHVCGRSSTGSITCRNLQERADSELESDLHYAFGEPSGDQFAQISAGNFYSCAMTNDGAVQCWGGPTGPSKSPFQELAIGEEHVCGINANGRVHCTGRDDRNQGVAPGAARFRKVAAGSAHTCALADDATIECWGLGTEDGPSAPTRDCDQPKSSSLVKYDCGQASPPDGGDYVDVVATRERSCALTTDGDVRCWGRANDSGDRRLDAPSIDQFDVSDQFGCGISEKASLHCWGDVPHERASVASGDRVDPPSRDDLEQVATGADFACALHKSGRVDCWGNGDAKGADPPQDVRFSNIAAGGGNVCGLVEEDGTIQCWGQGASASAEDDHFPCGEGGHTELAVSTGGACAIESSGKVRCRKSLTERELLVRDD